MKMTINLRKVLFFLLTLCLIGSAYAQDTALKEAEVAYTKEDYAKAIELYEPETMRIEGVDHLHAVNHSIVQDRIEAGTFIKTGHELIL